MNKIKMVLSLFLLSIVLVACGDPDSYEENEPEDNITEEKQDVKEEKQDVIEEKEDVQEEKNAEEESNGEESSED